VIDIPRELLYEDGHKEALTLGWEARNKMKKSRDPDKLSKNYAKKFKLLLSMKHNTQTIRQDLQERILLEQRSAIDVIADFLTPLRKHILTTIQNAEYEEEFIKWILRWNFTVPADWDSPARRQMKEAARMAGFEGVIKLISEPEAAALYILEKRVEEKKKLTVREDDISIRRKASDPP
jgi:molecular chaperone DnaK (HSP70)